MSFAIGTVVGNQRRQNAAVGGAAALVFKVDVARVVGIVGDQQDVILPSLGVVDIAMLGGRRTVAAVHDVAARQLLAGGVDVVKRPPAVEVDINSWGALHENVKVARIFDSHVIESRIGGA